MEAAALMNIENSYKTPQSLGKAISRKWKVTKIYMKKQPVIKALAKNSGIIIVKNSLAMLPLMKQNSL